MSRIPAEVVSKLTEIQNQIWQTVSLSVNEVSKQALNFASPLTVATKTSDLYAEIAAPMMVIQFGFTSLPEHSQVVLIPQETAIGLASLIKDEDVKEIDDNLVTEMRDTLEGIVNGICLAIGNVKNEAMVASALTVRFQIFSFPPNLQKSEELLRTQVAISGEGLNGAAIWLMDSDTAHHIVGMAMTEGGENEMPFQQAASLAGGAAQGKFPGEEAGLELLLDIPLEISVELGRVKMLVKDVVELGMGSIVEIDKAAGEPVDVMVNGRLVARGEVVVIEDNFGVRITEIINPSERLNKLGEAA